MIAAVILAGGKSERMGVPKALLRYQGLTFLEHIVRTIDASGRITHSVLVVGRHAREIAAQARGVQLVPNPDYARGMTTSFQAGIRALPEGVDSIVVFLVDHPAVTPHTVSQLLDGAARADIVVPVYEGRRGHPVVFSRRIMDEILRLPVDRGVNSIVASGAERVEEVAVSDLGVLLDIDTPEDFEALTRESGN